LSKEPSYYVREGGLHYHKKRECVMLEGKQFEAYNYQLMLLSIIKRKRLSPCPGCSAEDYSRRIK